MQKAFDTVNHDISLKKMDFIGFSDKKQQNGLNLICQIGNLKFILRMLSQNPGTFYAEFLKDPF